MFIVLSLSTLYLAALGCAVFPFTKVTGNFLNRAALALALGILVNYCLMLTGQTIGRVLLAGLALGMLGALRFGRRPKRIAELAETTRRCSPCVASAVPSSTISRYLWNCFWSGTLARSGSFTPR